MNRPLNGAETFSTRNKTKWVTNFYIGEYYEQLKTNFDWISYQQPDRRW